PLLWRRSGSRPCRPPCAGSRTAVRRSTVWRRRSSSPWAARPRGPGPGPAGRAVGSAAGGLVTPRSYPLGAAVDKVGRGVQAEHQQQQDESRRVGFLRLVEVSGRRRLVDEVGQRGAGAAQVVEREGRPFDRAEVLRRAEQDEDDRGVPDDPAEPEHPAGGDLRTRGGEEDAPRRRRLGLADRVGGLADVAGDRVQPLAGRGDDQRQRLQRQHRGGGEKGATEDDPFVRAAEEAEGGAGEDDRAEQGEDDRGDAGDRLDRQLGHPGERSRPAVLDQPDRDRNADRQRQGDPHRAQDQGADEGVGEPARFAFGEARGGGGGQLRNLQVLDPLDQQEDDDRHGDRAEEQAQEPAERKPEPVQEAPGGAALDRLGRRPVARVGGDGAAGDADLELGLLRDRAVPAAGRALHHAAPYLAIDRRVAQPASENIAAEKSRKAAIANRVALAGGELSWSMLLTIVGASGREGS